MSDINTLPQEEELDATANGTEVVEALAETTDVTKPEAPKSVSLDDALAQAAAKHLTPDAKAKTALPVTETTEAAPADKILDPITGRTLEPMKAPAGWTPALREKWSTIDPTVQKFIRDQEVHVSKKLQDVADERKLASEFKDIAAPYEAMLRGFNTTAAAHAKELFNLSHTLNTGSPQTRAQVIYNLINHFQPDKNTLTQLFSGQQPQIQQTQAQPSVDELVEKKFQAREKAQEEQSIASEIDRFAKDPKNVYYEDVRDTMGRIITAELVSGGSLPELFANAYKLACSQHPEIAAIQARTVTPTSAQPTAKPVASIKPSLGTGAKSKAPPKSMNLNDAVEQAFRKHNPA